MASSKLSMKLLVDSRGKRVLFAEADKECVDFLFYLLSLPVATIVRLLREEGMGGSLPKLYQSLENLDNTYIEADKNKDAFLKPAVPVSSCSVPLLALALEGASAPRKDSYKCDSFSYGSVSDRPATNSLVFGKDSFTLGGIQMDKNASNVKGGGLVKRVVTYMVMDDLEVKPMSAISSIAMLNSFNVKDVGALEEKLVTLDMKEALKLLKISLESNTVLTDLFCNVY